MGMKTQLRDIDSRFLKRFYVSELLTNLAGAPLASAYGGLMINFSNVPLRDFLLQVALIMCLNQVFIAMPLNLFIARKARLALAAWRAGELDDEAQTSLFSFLSILPLLQSGLIILRMFLCGAASLMLIPESFENSYHFASIMVFALYASFMTGLFIYYFLHDASSKIVEDLSCGARSDVYALIAGKTIALSNFLSYLPLFVPTAITSFGVFFLVMVIRSDPGNLDFFVVRIVFALVMNILVMSPVLLFRQRFYNRRLQSIQTTLRDMSLRGDTSGNIPTDFSDDYGYTAHLINKTFDFFRLVIFQMESASIKLSGAVMSFSPQIRETIAATTQQASAVKEVVSTMEGSNRINRQIQGQSETLLANAHESQSLVADGFGKVQDTIQKMGEIRETNLQTLNEIGGLTEEISSIGEIIDIINGIANQTRIIAFNAELEASSAGSAGTSFRIVAEEIRRLANSTVESLVGIKGRISEIQQGSERLLVTSEEGTVKIEEGMHLSADLNDIFMNIRLSAESTTGSVNGISQILLEQNEAFDQIFTTLKQISEGAEQVLESTRISGSEVSKLKDLIDDIRKLLTRFDAEADGTKIGEASTGVAE
jgi:methyl-accepting chemotaxis protein